MDTQYNDHVQEFLSYKSIGIAGFSINSENTGNFIFKKLQTNGYDVYAINPKAEDSINGKIFSSISAVPVQLQGVVICTHPSITESVIEECAKAGVKMVWIHKSVGEGSYSLSALEKAKKLGLKVIPIGCPMMFIKPDIFHKCFKFFMKKKLKIA
jgi:uncharacterized protein